MKKIVIAVVVLAMCTGSAYAGCKCGKANKSELGKEVVSTVTDTGKSAAEGTAKTVKDSVTKTPEAPMTAIQATKNTASTALNRADAAIKTLTGDKE